MKTEEIRISDWGRILFGEVPPSFFIEVVIRTIIIFFLLIISMRLFGKRMAAQVNRIEMVSLFTLAAAIGVPLQSPDRGILPAFVIALVVILIGRLFAGVAYGNERLQAKMEDRLTIMANDGVIDLKKVKGTKLTLERIYAQLRTEGIRHLGEVKRLYLEANGSFSVVKETVPTCGLSVLPVSDKAFVDEQTHCEEEVCSDCGMKKKDNPAAVCANCNNRRWVNAIM